MSDAVNIETGSTPVDKTGGLIGRDKAKPAEKAREKRMPKVLRNAVLSTLAVVGGLEGIGAITTELTDKESFLRNPAYTSSAGPLLKAEYDLLHPLGWETNIRKNNELPPSNFDKKADKQDVLVGVNAELITVNDLPSILKDATKSVEKNSFPEESILFPVKIAANQKIEIDTLYVNGVWNIISNKPDLLPVGKILTIPKKGTEIIVPIEGAEIFQLPYYTVNGKLYFNGIALQYFGPDGTRFNLVITSPQDIRQLMPMEIIKEAPILEPLDLQKNTSSVAKGKGLSMPAGTSILKTNSDNARVEFALDYYPDYYVRGSSYNFSFMTNDDNTKILCIPASTDN